MDRRDVFAAIDKEAAYQDRKWGKDKQQSLPGYLLIVRKELEEAENGWMKHGVDRHSCLNELLQAVTVGVRCLEQYGVTGSARPTWDRSEEDDRATSVTLTLTSDILIEIEKEDFIQATRNNVSGCTMIKTRHGAFSVKEDIQQVIPLFMK